MRSWKIGAAYVSQIVELVMPEGLPGLIPDATPEALLTIPWLYPEFITAKGEMSLSLHAFVIDTPTKRIVVDTCIGNDKNLAVAPDWSRLQTSFLRKMNDAGFPPGSVDVVVCTHLHLDHVGWNTTRIDGRWQPTFPGARYLFGRLEYEHMRRTLDAPDQEAAWRETSAAVERESLQPIIDAGLVDFVELDHRITDEVALTPTIGHTPGHVSIVVRSDGAEAIITGDAVHHPCQVARPDWGPAIDVDRETSRATRWTLLRNALERGQLVLGTHWPGAGGGTVVRDGNTFRLEFEPTVSRGAR
jgi:glyoxylase-like metal-dependent hydrolase (beta-lactamase superfamily II)